MMTLDEATRVQLLQKSKNADNYKDSRINRYKRRTKSRVATTIQDYNKIDMNKFFKSDLLTLSIQVTGETDKYEVKVTLSGVLDQLQHQLKMSGSALDIRSILRALSTVFNKADIYSACSCPDWKYRFSYFSTKNNTTAGDPEDRPSNITNPDDTKGAGCKHILLVLSNTSWLMKLAICIKNYVDYIEKHYTKLYADLIYPRIYGEKYEDPVQLSLDDYDNDELDNDEINAANIEKRNSTLFKQGNQQGVRYAKSIPDEDDQLELDDM